MWNGLVIILVKTCLVILLKCGAVAIMSLQSSFHSIAFILSTLVDTFFIMMRLYYVLAHKILSIAYIMHTDNNTTYSILVWKH